MTNEPDWTSPPLSEPPEVGKIYIQRNGERVCYVSGMALYKNGAYHNTNARHPLDLIREVPAPLKIKAWMNGELGQGAMIYETESHATYYAGRSGGTGKPRAVTVTITEGHEG